MIATQFEDHKKILTIVLAIECQIFGLATTCEQAIHSSTQKEVQRSHFLWMQLIR